MEKTKTNDHHHVEEGVDSTVESGPKNDFYVEDRVAHLSEEHRQYLLARHCTLDLDPIPDMNDADPYNWSTWRVRDIHAFYQNIPRSTLMRRNRKH